MKIQNDTGVQEGFNVKYTNIFEKLENNSFQKLQCFNYEIKMQAFLNNV